MCSGLLIKIFVLLLMVPRAAAGDNFFNATLGFPGEGPEAVRIRVDEASGGVLAWPSLPAPIGQVEPGADGSIGRQRGPRVKKSDKVWSIVTSNVTSWVRADVLLTDCLDWRRKPDVVLFQELCRDAKQLEAIEAGLATRRWQSAM